METIRKFRFETSVGLATAMLVLFIAKALEWNSMRDGRLFKRLL